MLKYLTQGKTFDSLISQKFLRNVIFEVIFFGSVKPEGRYSIENFTKH